MASLRKSVIIARNAAIAWDAIADIGQLHTRIAPGLVLDTRLSDGGATRLVTFANGMELVEHIVANDAGVRRLAWTAVSEDWSHHNASLQVFAREDGSSETVWIADVLPHEAAGSIEPIMELGLAAMKAHLEQST